MDEEDLQSLNSKTSRTQAVRIVRISNPTMVNTTPSEFRAVVQSLTGRKRSACEGLSWDCEKIHDVKVAKLQHHLSGGSNHSIPPSEDRRGSSENNLRNGADAKQVVHEEMSALFTSHMSESLENVGYSGFFSDLLFNQVDE